jgi:Amt family ammonium transporter
MKLLLLAEERDRRIYDLMLELWGGAQIHWLSTEDASRPDVRLPPCAVCVVCQPSGTALESGLWRPIAAKVPVILLADDPSETFERESRRTGASEVLPKSLVSRLLLERAVRYCTERQRERRAQARVSGRAKEQLAHARLHDALTGLPNRALLLDRIDRALKRSVRSAQCRYTVICLDLDQFKRINDTRGSEVGDAVIAETGRRLSDCLRGSDSVARLGHDEFAILIDEAAVEVHQAVVRRIRTSIAAPYQLSSGLVNVTATLGVALGSQRYTSAEEVLSDAETALRRARAYGRNGWCVFGGEMRADTEERWQLERELKEAIEADRIDVHYQPIVDLSRGSIRGFEALARWYHPSRGYVPAASFVQLAEECGLIVPLGARVLRRACAQAKQWLESGAGKSLGMSVNVSPIQLRERNMVEDVVAAINTVDLPPACLKIEVTETALMDKDHAGEEALAALRKLSIEVQIDDFGTGYSSLKHLTQLAIDTLKIDRSFVDGLGELDSKTKVVRAVVGLAHSLGMSVTAEGVETVGQLAFLRQIGCDSAQGFFFAKPMSAATAGMLLRQQPSW